MRPGKTPKALLALCLALFVAVIVAPHAAAAFAGAKGQLLWAAPQQIFLTDPSGHQPHLLSTGRFTPTLVGGAALSPVGDQFVFGGAPPGTVLNTGASLVVPFVLANVRTGAAHVFATFSQQYAPPVTSGTVAFYQNGAPAFSPDGRTVAFGYSTVTEPGKASSEDVAFLSVPTGRTTRLISIKGVIGAQPSVLQWLPTGRILFLAGGGTVETVKPNGSGRRSIRIGLPANTAIDSVATSPDGSQLALGVTTTACGVGNCRTDLYLVSATGGRATRLTSSGCAGAPVWSPNGKLIAYEDCPSIKIMMIATKRTTTIPRPSLQSSVVGWTKTTTTTPPSRTTPITTTSTTTTSSPVCGTDQDGDGDQKAGGVDDGDGCL